MTGKRQFWLGWPRYWTVVIALTTALMTGTIRASDPTSGLAPVAGATPSAENPLQSLGTWIWDTKTHDMQECRFWRTFELAATNRVVNARIFVTADNEFTLFLDGRELGRGAEWRELFCYDLMQVMTPGRHVLAIRAFNSTTFAGMLMGLRIEFADGANLEIKSDTNWRLAPESARNWTRVTRAPNSWPAAVEVSLPGNHPWWAEPQRINILPAPQPLQLHFWQTAWFQVPFCLVSGLVVLMLFFLAAQLALHQKERWLLQRERARIAMDIHDDVGSRITHLVLSGEVLQGQLPLNSKLRAQLGQICDEARGVLSSIDEILWALNPRRDTLQDFADYVCDYAQKFMAAADIECVFEIDSETMNVAADLPLRRSLLMAIKETLNNTAKYSGATELRLQIERHRKHLLVVVQDNGRGFDPHSVRPGRHGLENMSRRMRELGGECRLSSAPGKGCRIEFHLPLRSPRRFSLPGSSTASARLAPGVEDQPAGRSPAADKSRSPSI